jgi:hypothetical protein
MPETTATRTATALSTPALADRLRITAASPRRLPPTERAAFLSEAANRLELIDAQNRDRRQRLELERKAGALEAVSELNASVARHLDTFNLDHASPGEVIASTTASQARHLLELVLGAVETHHRQASARFLDASQNHADAQETNR